MILIALLIGVVVIVAALRNSQGALFNALGQDVPEFIVWAAALFAVGVLGYVPGLKPVSRALLALVIVVIILNNYQNILAGFQALAKSGSSSSSGTSAGVANAAQGSSVSSANSTGAASTAANALLNSSGGQGPVLSAEGA